MDTQSFLAERINAIANSIFDRVPFPPNIVLIKPLIMQIISMSLHNMPIGDQAEMLQFVQSEIDKIYAEYSRDWLKAQVRGGTASKDLGDTVVHLGGTIRRYI